MINKKSLQNIDPLKSKFLSVLSHEVRGPISNVVAMLDYCKNKYVSQLQKIIYGEVIDALNETNRIELVKELHQKFNILYDELELVRAEGIRSLSSLINLVSLHRFQSDGIHTRFESFNLQELINNAIANSIFPHRNKVFFHTEIKCELPDEIQIDYENIYQALRVIIGNAVRYSNVKSMVKIKVETLSKNSNAMICVSIQDFGVGISKDQLKYLFKTYLEDDQIDQHSRYCKHSLQLAQAKMRMEVGGGELNIQSEPGKGTTVTLLFPYFINKASISKNNKYTNSSRQNILLVEDDFLAQQSYQRYLIEHNYTVDIVDNGSNAIEKILTRPYNCVLLDITLPDMNGVEVMQKMRHKFGNTIYFVVITAHATDEDIEYFQQEGATAVLTKPFNQIELIDCLETIWTISNQPDEDLGLENSD